MIPTDLIYPYIFTFKEADNEPLSTHFEFMGWQTTDSLRNLGSTFIFLCIDVVILVMLIVFKNKQ